MKKSALLIIVVLAGFVTSFGQSSNNLSKQQYIIIFRFKSNFVARSQEEVQTNIKHWQEYMSNLGQSGKLVSGFRPTNEGRTISGTDKIVKQEAYIANNELISSFIIINALSMDEASEIAKKCPIFELNGSVEIRPLMQTAN
jgi:hypothetical protein